MKYRCLVTNSLGKKQNIIEMASSIENLNRQLSNRELYLISAKPVKESRGTYFKLKTIKDLTDTLKLLIESGLSLRDAFQIVSEVTTNGKTKQLAGLISEQLKKGNQLSEILGSIPGAFPPIYRGMVAIGEQTGSMGMVFSRLSEYLATKTAIREKTVSAMIYPLMVLSMAFLGMILMVIFLFPVIEQLFDQLGQAIPGNMNQAMGNFQKIITTSLILLASLLVFYFTFFFASKNNEKLGGYYAAFLLKIPVIGGLITTTETMNFVFAMEALTMAGIALENSMTQAEAVVKNRIFKQAILSAQSRLLEGEKLSLALQKERIFPDRVISWIGIGENSGQVTAVFSQLRGYYQGQMEKISSRFITLIEPVLIVLSGIIIITIIFLFIIPIFSLFGNII